MDTITAVKLKRLLNLVPDNTPIYIVGTANENGLVSDVAICSDAEKGFTRFEIRIDWVVE